MGFWSDISLTKIIKSSLKDALCKDDDYGTSLSTPPWRNTGGIPLRYGDRNEDDVAEEFI